MRFRPGRKIYRNYFGQQQNIEDGADELDDDEEEEEEMDQDDGLQDEQEDYDEEIEPIYDYMHRHPGADANENEQQNQQNNEEDEEDSDDDYGDEDDSSSSSDSSQFGQKKKEAKKNEELNQDIKIEEKGSQQVDQNEFKKGIESPIYEPFKQSEFFNYDGLQIKEEDCNNIEIKIADEFRFSPGYNPFQPNRGDMIFQQDLPSRQANAASSLNPLGRGGLDRERDRNERSMSRFMDYMKEKEAKKESEMKNLFSGASAIGSNANSLFSDIKPLARAQTYMHPYGRDIPDRFMNEGLGIKRNISYREYKEKMEKMLNSKIDIGNIRESARASAAASAGLKLSEFEADFKKKREQKEQRKKKLAEKKLKIMKGFGLLSEDNQFKLIGNKKESTKTMKEFQDKFIDFNKKEKKQKNKMKNIVDALVDNKNGARPYRTQIQQAEIKQIADKFKLTLEDAERAFTLKKEIDQMQLIINNAKVQKQQQSQLSSANISIPPQNQDPSNKDYLISEIEKYKNGQKNYFDLKNLDETEEEMYLMQCTEYDEDLEVMMNVFIKRLENANKRVK